MTEEEPKIQAPFDEQTQQLINAGRMAMMEKNFMAILANIVKQSPNKRIEIPLNQSEMQINISFDFQPDKLTIYEIDAPKEPLIKLASQMPKSGIPKLEIKH